MEVLKNYEGSVEFVVPKVLTQAQASISRNNVVLVATQPATVANGVATVTLPWSAVSQAGTVSVKLTFHHLGTNYTQSADVDVVTPYLDIHDVKKILDEDATDSDAIEIEAAVRHIINAHTGQSFGLTTKTLTVEGHGESALRLPERLVEVTSVNTLTAGLDPRAFIIVSDGWYLKKSWANEVSQIDSDSEYWGDYNGGVFNNGIYHDPDDSVNPPADTTGLVGPLGSRPGGVIVAPGTTGRSTPWKNDYPFAITGTWGYKTVPVAVQEAAKLLINDYACGEIMYRDRYLESIKASDWRLQFSSRAWDSTGNVRADQLLAEFVLVDMAVI